MTRKVLLGCGALSSVLYLGAIDVQQECRRLSAEVERLEQLMANLATRLSSEHFVSRAPADVVAREREKERTWREQRDVLAPINRKYKLEELMDVCREFPLRRRSRITFEYVLLDRVNDTPEDARRLVRLLDGIQAKVNLLPLNEAEGIPYKRPSDERVNAFAAILADHDVTVSVRTSRGRDIRAACGQLLVETATARK